MMLNKKVIESFAVVMFAASLSITAVTNTEVTVAKSEVAVEKMIANTSSLEQDGLAGVTATLNDYKEDATEESERVSVEKEDVVMVASAFENEDAKEVDEDDLSQVEAWEDNLMADVDESLNVRKKASEKAEVVGKLRKGDLATIVEEGEEWTKIKSGNVEGYVSNEYCVIGEDAFEYAGKNCKTVATVETDMLRVREEESTDAKVIVAVEKGTELVVDTKAEVEDGWVAVKYDSETRYVSAEFVSVELKTGKGITLKEEAEARAKAQAEAAKKAAQSQQKKPSTKKGAGVKGGADSVSLLAALIYCEAGGECYQAQLGIGAVVVNRMKSGSFPSTLSGVIYQRGQFGPASSGKLARILAKGAPATARKAAQAALAGQDNTGGAKYFKLARSGHKGVKIGRIVFY